jgi:hypothetical protein
LQGLGACEFGDASDLREIQYEAAWRMCKWDPDLVARFQGFRVTLDRFISYRFHRLLLSFKLHDYRF